MYCAMTQSSDSPSYSLIGTPITLFANRISYALDLKGPSYTLSSACSSSGVALNDAIQLIRSGQCDSALVGGSFINLNPLLAKLYNNMNLLSHDGKCKFLDQSADGFVRSEACVVIHLQKLNNAKRVYANIVSSMTNVDGYKIEGLTYPLSSAQVTLMRDTLTNANVSPK